MRYLPNQIFSDYLLSLPIDAKDQPTKDYLLTCIAQCQGTSPDLYECLAEEFYNENFTYETLLAFNIKYKLFTNEEHIKSLWIKLLKEYPED